MPVHACSCLFWPVAVHASYAICYVLLYTGMLLAVLAVPWLSMTVKYSYSDSWTTHTVRIEVRSEWWDRNNNIQLQATSLKPKIDWPVAILRLCLFLHSALPQCHPSTAQSERQLDSSMTQWSLAGQSWRTGGIWRHNLRDQEGLLPPVGGEWSKQPVHSTHTGRLPTEDTLHGAAGPARCFSFPHHRYIVYMYTVKHLWDLDFCREVSLTQGLHLDVRHWVKHFCCCCGLGYIAKD